MAGTFERTEPPENRHSASCTLFQLRMLSGQRFALMRIGGDRSGSQCALSLRLLSCGAAFSGAWVAAAFSGSALMV
ncbi:hypothetical protein CQ12_36880 [Bradyrhizobium jicamae]|uniref:Uncharacterized protein n=1 Tax=Bradyrhizobium jicamae TaxID=280332 RepID=A0A0R3LSU3_9BRAD|nr:hypothetical protein CQ12_36880 [Bradyrhizobium jicamae]